MDRNYFLQGLVGRGGVALRKESVDRNNFCRLHYNITVMVALRKESVDRNIFADASKISELGRSPQGERG